MNNFIQKVCDEANESNKNILIIGSARSGTHALGSEIINTDPSIIHVGEICQTVPDKEIIDFCNSKQKSCAHITSLTAKLKISSNVKIIKDHSIIINIKRRDKVKQFASWIYAIKLSRSKWHNIQSTQFCGSERCITASQEDIDQFMLEQMLDSFFHPDHTVMYEDMNFLLSGYKKNSYPIDLIDIFDNKDFVIDSLKNWKYHE